MDQEQSSREVRTTNEQVGATNVQRQVVTDRQAAPNNIVAQRVVWYIAGFIIALLVLRMVLLLLAANQGNAFVDFIYGFSGIFAAPFFGIFSYTPVYGSNVFETSTLVAIVIYALVAWGIAKLFTLNSTRQDV